MIDRVLGNLAGYRPFRDGVGNLGVLRLTGPVAYTLAIHPIRDAHPHRYVRSEEIGLAYTILADQTVHYRVQGAHYSQLRRPIVRQDALRTAAAIAWFGALLPARVALAEGWRQRILRPLRQAKRRLLRQPPLPSNTRQATGRDEPSPPRTR